MIITPIQTSLELGPKYGRCGVSRLTYPPCWRNRLMDGRRYRVHERHNALAIKNVPIIQIRVHPVRTPTLHRLHRRKLHHRHNRRNISIRIHHASGANARSEHCWIPLRPNWSDNRTHRLDNSVRSHGSLRPKVPIPHKASSRPADTTQDRESAETNGNRRTTGSRTPRNRPDPNGHRRKLVKAPFQHGL